MCKMRGGNTVRQSPNHVPISVWLCLDGQILVYLLAMLYTVLDSIFTVPWWHVLKKADNSSQILKLDVCLPAVSKLPAPIFRLN